MKESIMYGYQDKYYGGSLRPRTDYYEQRAMEYGRMAPDMICRAVSNADEARAAMIDPMSINIFTDFANGKMYVKRIDNNGNSLLHTFMLDNNPAKPANYAEQISALETRNTELEKRVTDLEGFKTSKNEVAA
jgi:hypothetical protein